MNQNQGRSLARLRERFICRAGTTVTLNTGVSLRALIHHADHELLRARTDDDNSERQPVVFVFGGSAWGKIAEGTLITVGGPVAPKGAGVTGGPVDMTRYFKVAPPLHPKWRQDVVTEIAVVAFQNV